MSSSLADAHTEVRTERITYSWSIKGFDLLPTVIGRKIRSPWFYSKNKCEGWRLELYPRGRRASALEGIDYVGLNLSRHSPGQSAITVFAELKISKSNLILRNLSFSHEYETKQTIGCEKFLLRSKLLTTNSSDDDEFTISCVIDLPAKVITSSLDAPNFDSRNGQLIDDFRLLFEDPIFSDFTIIVGNQKFATHKVILARRSPVFAAMFQHKDLKESRNNEVKIENIEPDVIRGMLEFIYTDEVTNIKELASGLLEVADKYDLKKLRIMCEKTLYEGLNRQNAAEILQLADLHHADTLKKYVIKYIVDHAPKVVESTNWKRLGGNPELLLELFNHSILPKEKMKQLKVQKNKSKV